jgi:hypothetical protein
MMAEELLSAAGPIERLIADTAYDTTRLRPVTPQGGRLAMPRFSVRDLTRPRQRIESLPAVRRSSECGICEVGASVGSTGLKRSRQYASAIACVEGGPGRVPAASAFQLPPRDTDGYDK